MRDYHECMDVADDDVEEGPGLVPTIIAWVVGIGLLIWLFSL